MSFFKIKKTKPQSLEDPAAKVEESPLASLEEALNVKRLDKKPLNRRAEATPYEANHRLERLEFLIVVVNEGQDGAIIKIVQDGGAAVSFSAHGKGTASSDLYEVFGFSNNAKHIVFSLIKESSWGPIKAALVNRFSYSNWSKGLAVLVNVDSVCGVSSYRFLTNTRTLDEGKGVVAMSEIQKKDDYQVIMAIVNDGFTDLVMDAAKKAGARGGTIMTAHGTGNKDIEKFFGVVITPEKQIVMILVSKAIKDDVIASIYKEVGINTKGQGIAFSFPAGDVVGIVENKTNEGEENSAETPSNLQNAPK